MRLRRDTIFRVHTFGIVALAFGAVVLHRSADARRVDALAAQLVELRKEIAAKADYVPVEASSGSSAPVEAYYPVEDDPPPKIRIIGHGYTGRYMYLDCRLCDGVIRRCYIRRDESHKKRDVARVSEMLDELNGYLWTGGYDLALRSSSPALDSSPIE